MSPAADSKSKVTEPKRRLWRMKRGGGIGRKGELPLERGKATIEDAELRPFDASQGFFDSLGMPCFRSRACFFCAHSCPCQIAEKGIFMYNDRDSRNVLRRAA